MYDYLMPLEKALDIVDPETSQDALAPFTGDCILTRELMTDARRIVAANGRQLRKALQDNGFRDLDDLLRTLSQVKAECQALCDTLVNVSRRM